MLNHELHSSTYTSFSDFLPDSTTFALPIGLSSGKLEAQPVVYFPTTNSTPLQSILNLLKPILEPCTALYLILRLPNYKNLVVVTFIPYLASQCDKDHLLNHRHNLIKALGEHEFELQLICKETGEVLDVRSWEERDTTRSKGLGEETRTVKKDGKEGVLDLGYQKTRCRLCDRRMQNDIEDTALTALRELKAQTGTAVTLRVNETSQLLTLVSTNRLLPSQALPVAIPADSPTYTFYIHPVSGLVYFIAHSPDSANVKQRMLHTMGIPAVLVHAEDSGIEINFRREIHDLREIEVGLGDGESMNNGEDEEGKVGKSEVKYRSMYERKAFKGTELVYTNLERDREVLDGIV